MGSASLANTKRRIASVQATLKITSAMKVVATAKLKNYKSKLGDSLEYVDSLQAVVAKVLANLESDDPDNINRYAAGSKRLILLVTSSLGLCGSYNNAVLKEFGALYRPGDVVYVIGSKGEANLSFNKIAARIDFVESFHAFDYSVSRRLGNFLLDEFKTGAYSSVLVVGTQFVNSLVFRPLVRQLFPVELSDRAQSDSLIEPNPNKVFNRLLPQYVNALVYQILLNSLVSEYASRRNAMESASDNAEDLIKDLALEYNKARQAAITQEITEVVSGANASH